MPRGLSEMPNTSGTAFLLPPWIPGVTMALLQKQHCSAEGEVWGDIPNIARVFLSAEKWWQQALAALPGPWAQKGHHVWGGRHRASSQTRNSDSSLPSLPWAAAVMWKATDISTVATLTILSKFWFSSVPMVYLCMISGDTGDCWIFNCRKHDLAT